MFPTPTPMTTTIGTVPVTTSNITKGTVSGSGSSSGSTSDSRYTTSPTIQNKNEVFNIANNLYTYDDAQAVCSAYGAQIATYEQVEDAYNQGAEWCNYGWSDGQMALFPTQKDTWNKLQKTKNNKNDCGRPGINGGFIDNPYVKFGVNCFLLAAVNFAHCVGVIGFFVLLFIYDSTFL
jgi:hypothetical protein